MSLFSTSAALRPSHCLLLRVASGPTLLTGIPHPMSPLRVKSRLEGNGGSWCRAETPERPRVSQADNATSPRGLCFSPSFFVFWSRRSAGTIAHTNRRGSLPRSHTCVPLAQCQGRTHWTLPEDGPSRGQAAGSDNDEAHGHEVDTDRHSPLSENR